MTINTDINTTAIKGSATYRAVQLSLFAREVKIITEQLITGINTGSIPAQFLVQKQNSLAQVKANLQSWPYGSLTDLDVRNALIDLGLTTSITPAEVQTEIASLNTAFNNLLAEIESILVIARANGQIFDADSVTGLQVIMTLSSPETDDLLVLAQSVTASIN